MSPTKSHYQRRYKDDLESVINFLESSAFQAAVIHVKAEMVEGGATAENVKGAMDFLKRLNALAQPETPVGTMPDKSLKSEAEILAEFREQEQRGAT